MLKEVLKLLRATLPATIEMKRNISSNSVVLADSTQIHQLIINLCTNAAHAMEKKGGILTVELKDVKLEAELTQRPTNLVPGSYTQLTVSDTGHGMTPAVMERIFDPFFTTKEKGKGTGIGLSAVHGIIKSHAGEITVSSKPGKGSTFKVFLPRIDKDLVEDDGIKQSKPNGNEYILFVDDEQAIVNIGKEMLTRLGYKVNACTGSQAALEAFKRQPEKFDLVVCDMTMPKMTGEELALKLREIRTDIPIILCTGFNAKMSEITAKNIGINAFLLKPLTMSEIGSVIRRVLDQN
jgi:CheY-like chemotaxis protein